MKIFQLRADVDNYNYFDFTNKNQLGNKAFDGRKLLNTWEQPKIKFCRAKKYPLGDIAMLMTLTPAIKGNAVNVFKDIFTNNVELLPVVYSEPYYLVNVINIIDALDEEKSEFERYSSGKIMFCTKYAFKKDIIGNAHIFKIPQFPTVNILVTEEFVKRVEENNLKGFVFEELWDSEN